MFRILVWVVVVFAYLLPLLYFLFSLSSLNLEYLKLVFTPSDIKLLSLSLVYAFFIGVASTFLGSILSFVLIFSDLKYKKEFFLSFLLPILIPTYIFVFAWMGFLGKRGTFLPYNIPNIPLDIYNPFAFVLFSTLSYFPFSLIFTGLGFMLLDEKLIDAARLVTKSKWKIVKGIILPLMRPYLLLSFVFPFAFSLSEFTVPSFLRVNTYQLEIFTQLATFYDLRKASVYSLPLLFISLVLMFLSYKKIKHIDLTRISKRHKPLMKSNKILYLILLFFLFISIGAPLFMLFLESEGKLFVSVVNAKTQILNSILLCFIVSTISTFVGFLSVILYEEKASTLLLTLFLPTPILALTILNLYSRVTTNYMLMMLLGYIARYLPFSVLIFLASFSRISQSIKNSVKLLDRPFWKKVFAFYLPLQSKAFLVSFLSLFVLSMMEVDLPQMLSPPGFQTLSLRIETLMHYADYAQVSSLSLFLVLFLLVIYSVIGVIGETGD